MSEIENISEIDLFPKSLDQLRKEQERYDAISGIDLRLHQVPANYAEMLDEPDGTAIGSILSSASRMIARPQKLWPQSMDYETARKIVWAICTDKARVLQKDFIVDAANRAVIQNLIRYFINDPACEWNLNKGLFIFGDVGRGKTFLFQVMQVFAAAARLEHRNFGFQICSDIVDEVLTVGESAMARHFRGQRDVCFDDLGQEPAVIKRYGNDLSVMERILTKRYSAYVAGKCITHITSNLTPDEVLERYGSRVSDRLREMMNYVVLPGPSRRK